MKEIMDNESKGMSRRDLVVGAGKLAAGAAVVSASGLTLPDLAKASSSASFPYPYKKLDPEAVAEKAYHAWYKDYCSMAVAEGIIGELREKVGGPYNSYPIEAIRWAHGGGAGWGTLCGTMVGAGTAAALIAGTKDGDHIINDVIYWYSTTSLPTYSPKVAKLPDPIKTRADSPLCHVSVNTWMSAAGHKFFTPERKDRCARLAASVAMKTTELLNAYHEGDYEPTHSSQMKTHDGPAQNNCLECHGS